MEPNEFIKTMRKKLGLTQEELAALLRKPQSSISKYERGTSMPPGDVILKIQSLVVSIADTKR